MANIYDVLGWFMSGQGRLVGAAALFVTMWVVKNVPWVSTWLDADSWGWLTSKRKKFAATLLLAMGPTIVALTDPTKTNEQVLVTTLIVVLAAMGLQGGAKALKASGS